MEPTPRDLLTQAEGLLARPEEDTAGLWPRASALLASRALEAAVHRRWETRALDLRRCPFRVQLVCLRLYLKDDGDLAARTGHAWAALRKACHHHAYELAPTASELSGWLAVVSELVGREPEP